jgi:glutamate-1-semialdehyde 2,1-aminomutase
MRAATDQLEKGTVFGAPTQLEIAHSAEIRKRMPSIEKVRYTATGTEACMFAARLARAHTGRKKIAKFEGGYHGSSEIASVSVHPERRGNSRRTLIPKPDTLGLSSGVVENTTVLPFNDFDAVYSIVRRNKDDLACIIVEPIMRAIPPAPSFLRSIRELADDLDIVLIFDEVITGFRISTGGAQERYHVKPDLTTMGKVIGGGFPVGAVGGNEEIMSLMAHQKIDFPTLEGPKVPHAGTFNAHPVTMAAGIETLSKLRSDSYEKLDKSGDRLRRGLIEVLSANGINAQVIGVGSLFDIRFAENEITDYETSSTADPFLRRCLDLDLLNRGVFLPPLHFGCTSTASTLDHIDDTLEQVSTTLHMLLPLIRERRPQLLVT